ncbi:hypothetical protein MKX01_023025 [Papaver californicum]|nr:hypothetical protein MKX01_023025 [Papaver californicum]
MSNEIYGFLRQPKHGHLKELHMSIKLSERAIVSADPIITSLGTTNRPMSSLPSTMVVSLFSQITMQSLLQGLYSTKCITTFLLGPSAFFLVARLLHSTQQQLESKHPARKCYMVTVNCSHGKLTMKIQ